MGSPNKRSPSHKATSPNKRFRIAGDSEDEEEELKTSPLKDFADFKAPELQNKGGFGHNKSMALTMYGTT